MWWTTKSDTFTLLKGCVGCWYFPPAKTYLSDFSADAFNHSFTPLLPLPLSLSPFFWASQSAPNSTSRSDAKAIPKNSANLSQAPNDPIMPSLVQSKDWNVSDGYSQLHTEGEQRRAESEQINFGQSLRTYCSFGLWTWSVSRVTCGQHVGD